MNDDSRRPRPDRDAEPDLDPGAYIGRMPERATETIPGGVGRRDERVAAHSTRAGTAVGQARPTGHREGRSATDDDVREAGQDR
jgi:hypothetical protein